MDVYFNCTNPLNTVTRVMDIARRMNIDVDQMAMQRKSCGQFAVNFALTTGDQALHENFCARLRQCHDLTQDTHDV